MRRRQPLGSLNATELFNTGTKYLPSGSVVGEYSRGLHYTISMRFGTYDQDKVPYRIILDMAKRGLAVAGVGQGPIHLHSLSSTSNQTVSMDLAFTVVTADYHSLDGISGGVFGLSQSNSQSNAQQNPSIFGLYVSNLNNGDHGEFSVGGVDVNRIAGPVSFVNVNSDIDGFYSIEMNGATWQVGSNRVRDVRLARGFLKSGSVGVGGNKIDKLIVDNAVPGIVLESEVADEINLALGGVPEVNPPSSETRLWYFDCSSIQSYPTLTITFANHKFTLEPSFYIHRDKNNICTSQIHGNAIQIGDAVLGNVFMRKYVTILERSNENGGGRARVGFAVARHGEFNQGYFGGFGRVWRYTVGRWYLDRYINGWYEDESVRVTGGRGPSFKVDDGKVGSDQSAGGGNEDFGAVVVLVVLMVALICLMILLVWHWKRGQLDDDDDDQWVAPFETSHNDYDKYDRYNLESFLISPGSARTEFRHIVESRI
ncbi:hypothetical protein HDU76_011970 [Blyttiomyces sp. JEL0837]|nr:hypothetical protein HDU76_011970 [Blyttiomyces sp. JEL0837]